MIRRPPRSTLFPTRRSSDLDEDAMSESNASSDGESNNAVNNDDDDALEDRKSTRLTPVTMHYIVCRLLLEKKQNTIHADGCAHFQRESADDNLGISCID